MLHMLNTFDLRPGVEPEELAVAYARLIEHLAELDLVAGTSPLARRRRHPCLDTDRAREHGFAVTTRFRDRRQADACYARLKARAEPTGRLHRAVLVRVQDPVFSVWEDIA